ncbi:hypothetical protein D3C85_440320 [compost metagenome]
MIKGTCTSPSGDISDHCLIISELLVMGAKISHLSQSNWLKLPCCLRGERCVAKAAFVNVRFWPKEELADCPLGSWAASNERPLLASAHHHRQSSVKCG